MKKLAVGDQVTIVEYSGAIHAHGVVEAITESSGIRYLKVNGQQYTDLNVVPTERAQEYATLIIQKRKAVAYLEAEYNQLLTAMTREWR